MNWYSGRFDMDLLNKIYSLYLQAMNGVDVDPVCREKCSSCCTCNVTLTSLEADFILSSLSIAEKQVLLNRIRQKIPEKRYIPKMTTNGFARLCMENQDTPVEENDPAFGPCPLLKDNLCTIYEVRPFGCRALMSASHCNKEGYARVPPVVLTLNTLFLQVIEHLDQKGCSGNLSDLLTATLSDHDLTDMTGETNDINSERLFLRNEKIPVLMIPPEHQQELKPLIGKLFNLSEI
jgi:Fe-S-cluster containining protein